MSDVALSDSDVEAQRATIRTARAQLGEQIKAALDKLQMTPREFSKAIHRDHGMVLEMLRGESARVRIVSSAVDYLTTTNAQPSAKQRIDAELTTIQQLVPTAVLLLPAASTFAQVEAARATQAVTQR